MNQYGNLLLRISEEFDIPRGKSEDISSWKSRIVYSLLGRMALASLYDISETENVSIIHMKRRVDAILKSYREMYPDIRGLLPYNAEELAQEICDIYQACGVVYHEPNRLTMACAADAISGDILFTRGHDLEDKQSISGLGSYLHGPKGNNTLSLGELYQLEESPLQNIWNQLTSNIQWTEYTDDVPTEYLLLKPPFIKGYWSNKPSVGGVISLMRTGYHGSRLYYLYKIESGITYVSQLPQWKVEDYNYRVLASACLADNNTLPPTKYRYDGELAYFSFGYLPPPAELYLWKLYSWPVSMISLPSDFNRVCTRCVFDQIKSVMTNLGYSFIEE